jgi:hypothetical protein
MAENESALLGFSGHKIPKKKTLKNDPLDDVHFSYIKILKKKKEKN